MYPDQQQRMSKRSVFGVSHVLLPTVAVSLVVLGVFLNFTWSHIFTFILHKQLVLTPGSQTYDIWKEPPVPIYINFYFFNWTNADQLGKEKPQLVQLGPYRFNEKDEKTGVVWNKNGTITFKRHREWYFDEERSNGSLDDVVTTLNPVALSAARSVKYRSYIMKRALSVSISSNKEKVEVSQTVGEMLFEGYSDPLLDLANKLPAFAGVDIPYDKFGWFYLRNGSDTFEGVFNMDTGVDNITQFGKLHNWNYNNHTSYYEGSCGEVRGTAGEIFHPGQSKTRPVEMYSADLCRSISLPFKEEVEVMGIRGNKYVGDEDVVDNGTRAEENRCYCDGECVPSGVINVTSCRLGAPGFVSYPHFYLGDSYFGDQVQGMSPRSDLHSLYLVLEPTTGIPLDVAARFQINLLLSPNSAISLYSDVPNIFFPMIWFEQRASISEELASLLRIVLNLPSVGQAVALTLLTTGLILMALYLHIVCRNNNNRKVEQFVEEMKVYGAEAEDPLLVGSVRHKPPPPLLHSDS